jgi:hypothetical protein
MSVVACLVIFWPLLYLNQFENIRTPQLPTNYYLLWFLLIFLFEAILALIFFLVEIFRSRRAKIFLRYLVLFFSIILCASWTSISIDGALFLWAHRIGLDFTMVISLLLLIYAVIYALLPLGVYFFVVGPTPKPSGSGPSGSSTRVGLFGPTVEKLGAQKDIPRLIKALDCHPNDIIEILFSSFERRYAAMEALKAIGAPAIDPLIAVLKDRDKDAGTRAAAARALGEMDDTRLVEPLITSLKDAPSDVREAAAEALGKMASPMVVVPLVAALKDFDFSVRWRAAEALGKIGDPKGVEPLIAALRDGEPIVRQCAAEALRKFKDPRADEAVAKISAPAAQPINKPSMAEGSNTVSSNESWKCSKCGGINPATRISCLGCNAPRPS